MHLVLKKKKLYIGNYKVKCAIGKRGLTNKKREGDLKTPKGKFKFLYLLYRKDRVKRISTKIPKKIIHENMGWCDDPESKNYNKLIRFKFEKNAEKLFLKKNLYNLILVLNYNLNPIIKGKGSAIFMHVATKKFSSTRGCIALKKNDLLKVLKLIDTKSTLSIR